MSKDSFNWKSLFINESENNDTSKKEEQAAAPIQTNSFPDAAAMPSQALSGNNPFLGEIVEVYQKGFEGLNAEGFDFFELYKSVQAVGVTNPQSYQMAFTMGKTINPNLSKDFLLEKAKFYIAEIDKVYAKYDSTGTSKKMELSNKITLEKTALATGITSLESKIADLQKELSHKKAELEKIDLVNQEHFSELDLKIEANNMAKKRILDSINTVITGINQYL
ncbi:hypothetical protein [Flavobacterium pedocola]